MEAIECPKFDEEKYWLGSLCPYGHEWGATGQSLRYIYRGRVTNCIVCARAKSKRQRQEQPERCREQWDRHRKDPNKRENRLAKRRDRFAAKKSIREAKAVEKSQRIAKERQEFELKISNLNEIHGIDTSIYTLRKLCKREHEYLNSGYSLATGRDVFKGSCVECRRESRARGAAGVNYRGRKLAAKHIPFNVKELEERIELFNGCCAYCGVTLKRNSKDCKHPDYLNWEHMIPLAKEGVHGMCNLVPSCKSCNGAKIARDVFEWYLNAEPKPNFYCPKRANIILLILAKTKSKD